MFAMGRDYRTKSWGRENLGLQRRERQIMGKDEVLGQLWENDVVCKTGEVGETGFLRTDVYCLLLCTGIFEEPIHVRPDIRPLTLKSRTTYPLITSVPMSQTLP